MSDAYQEQKHLLKIKEDLMRKNDLKKAAMQNKKQMERLQSVEKDYRDKQLIEKIGIPGQIKSDVNKMQSYLPDGGAGNAYFMANEIQFKNDQERRMKRNQKLFDSTL